MKLKRSELNNIIKEDNDINKGIDIIIRPPNVLPDIWTRKVFIELSKKHPDIKLEDLKITWNDPVGEYCIYIKEKWSGYVDEYILPEEDYRTFVDDILKNK